MIEDYTIPPTEEFKRIKEGDYRSELFPYLNRWHMMIKAVLNDYYFDAHEVNWIDDPGELDHFMHKLYFCWQEMGYAIYGHDDDEECYVVHYGDEEE